MKKSQTVVEYALILVLALMLCGFFAYFWNRQSMISGTTGGVEDASRRGVIVIPPMSN